MRVSATILLVAAWVHSATAAPVTYSSQIQPIFDNHCTSCHEAEGGKAQLSLADWSGITTGGKSGRVIEPGSPQNSLLLKKISGANPEMPARGDPLNSEQVFLIRRWINEGAKNDDGESPPEAPLWWSFRPLKEPIVPEGDPGWARTAIDQFVSAKLTEHGLSAAPEADRRTLIRRLKFDLHGLPPTPAEVDACIADESPRAYEDLVDRLLASPRYGERWGRHWLDVAHYGESHGYDKDKARRNSWPYRDYVIRSFNDDKPYVRFIKEQLAGDVPWPDDPVGVIATGFIAAGPWDYVGHAELREGTKDKKLVRLIDRDDMLAATMSTFNSLTVHCARCHDHKFDPIQQEDYYALQAVFAGVDRAEQPYDIDKATFQKRRALWFELREADAAIQPLTAGLAELSNVEIVSIDERLAVLRQESSNLQPKVGEEFTPQVVARKKEISAETAVLTRRRDAVGRSLMRVDDRTRLEQLESRRAKLNAALEALPEPRLVYSAASYFKTYGKFTPAWQPRPIHLLGRGSVESPGKPVGPGAVTSVAGKPARFDLPADANEGARRAALAEWIAAAENPLTWRSIVNRVWHYHFGRGLADSPNDFGRMGGEPTHPELLDWLALKFRDGGGSIKDLHRQILTSAVYRQSSAHHAANSKIDSSNQFLWRMNRVRLDAEAVRDSVLAVSGRLDLTMGGPSVEHFVFKDDHSPIYDYARFNFDSPGARRRSVYRFLVRSVQDPFMESLDCADPSLLVPKRSSTLTAVQALALLNDPLIVQESKHFADRLRERSPQLRAQIQTAHREAYGRTATEQEVEALAAHARSHGLENVARLIFNSNEFVFVD